MALLIPNPLVQALKGKMGDMYIAKYGNQLVIKRNPSRKPMPPSEAQKPGREHLVGGNAYWRTVRAQPQVKAVYVLAALAQGKRANDLAVADFMNAPMVTGIELSGYSGQPAGIVQVTATDDFEVVRVGVRILDLAGMVIEGGDAVLDGESQTWRYVATALIPAGLAVVLEITALDRPGHPAIKRFDHICGPR